MTDRKRSPLPAGYQFGDAASLKQSYRRLVDAVEGARCEIGDTIVVKLPGVKTFRLGRDICPTCGTTGKYDCLDCGCWSEIEGEHG